MAKNNLPETKIKKIITALVLLLIINLPVVSALQISSVRATTVLSNTATIQWETDRASDSFVDYGMNKENLQTLGDAIQKTGHSLVLNQLTPSTKYYYKVSSGNQVDDNQGKLYDFTTPEVDREPPKLKVKFPESIAGRSLEVTGETEAGVKVIVYVDKVKAGESTARQDGTFQLLGIQLKENQANLVVVTATDASGNIASVEGTVTSDTTAPKVDLENLPEMVTDRSVKLVGKISEESSYEIFIGNRSAGKGKGVDINEQVSLQEGKNQLKVVARDASGLETTVEFQITADLENQFIRAEIERGTEFYEGRAQSSISGKTKPGSKVFLYIFRPVGFEYAPDFSKARAVVAADANGDFRFEEVNFARQFTDLDLEDLAPKAVPEGLQKQKIFSADKISQQTQFTYHVYLISEDKLGRTAFTEQTVNVQTCLSGNLAFGVESLAQFQRPFRLVPNLLDRGRQEIQAVFSLTYTGSGVPGTSNTAASGYGYNNAYNTGYSPGGYGHTGYSPSYAYTSAQSAIEVEQGFRIISNPKIEPACTQKMRDDPKFGLGCKLIPPSPTSIVRNNDGTKYYVTWKLHSSEKLSKAEEDFWNEFKKRLLIMPLKITINYQEREGQDKWSTSKVQASCYDLGYSVDIPIDSKKLIPDFLANEGVDALNWTISQIQTVKPIVEKVYVVTASLAMVSFGLRTVARIYRIATSKIESTLSKVKEIGEAVAGTSGEEKRKCPIDQSKLYLQSTVEDWFELLDADYNQYKSLLPQHLVQARADDGRVIGDNVKTFILEEQCPSTASAWKLEAGTDTAWRWLWDRSFCRAVPAKWTQDKALAEIGSAIVKQQQCAVTGRGVPLTEVENCQKLVRAQVVNAPGSGTSVVTTTTGEQNLGTCWKDVQGTLYSYEPPAAGSTEADETQYGVFRLTPVTNLLGTPTASASKLLAYKPEGSDQYIIGREQTCAQVCKNPRRLDKYGADPTVPGGCYDEKIVDGKITLVIPGTTRTYGSTGTGGGEIKDKDSQAINDRYAAGYTQNCFIKGYQPGVLGSAGSIIKEGGKPVFQQCVCQGASDEKAYYQNEGMTLRTAVKRDGEVEEAYSYREDRIFKESGKSVGTYYPEIRYYSGRDVSGAFGANHLFDYFNLATGIPPKLHQVNPHNDVVGTFQSICLSGIHKNIRILESILVGIRNCIVQAKYTGLQDAGMCKTLFTQHVCGLLYKGIAYFTNSCTPLNFDETAKKGQVDALEIVKQGFSAIPEALETSIDDVRDDYGNAKLNEYFREGAQGVAQSMCLAAFGFEFPLLSEDFLLDAAYSFPTKSWVMLGPRERELSTFNPARQTAIFNYNIGGAIMPGCKIRNWKLSLKCIGPEDEGKPGVDPTCGGKGCDCRNAQGFSSGGLEVQKEKLLTTGFNLISGELFSIPLESPQSVDSPYRYDHVKVELFLDPIEKGNEDKCFEQGYFDGQKGVFYEPLVDTSPFIEASCQASAVTGQYSCPALSSLFGFGGANLEEPYISCWDKTAGTWTNCNAPNLYIADNRDDIKIGVHLNLDDKAKCLSRTVNPPIPGLKNDGIRQLPANSPGQLIITESLGNVDQSMFTGTGANLRLTLDSNPGCGNGLLATAANSANSGKFRLTFTPVLNAQNTFTVQVSGANVITTGYDIAGGLLRKDAAKTDLTSAEINQVIFDVGGHRTTGVLRNPNDLIAIQNKNYCEYEIQSQASAGQLNQRQINVRYELLELDAGGGCFTPNRPVASSQGRTSASVPITLQKSALGVAQAVGLGTSFAANNYDQVFIEANQIIAKRNGDVENALATFYYASALIMKGQNEGNPQNYAREVNNLLKLFFTRVDGQLRAESYNNILNDPQFQKIAAYMCKIDESYGGNYQVKSPENPEGLGLCENYGK